MCLLPARSQGLWLQDTHCGEGSQFYHVDPSQPANNKGYVTYGTVRGRETCMEVDPDHAITLFYRDKWCRFGRNEYEEFQDHKPTSWEPKCLIVLLQAESRRALRDELVEAGRILVHPLYACFLTHLNPAAPILTASLLPSVRQLTLSVPFADG